jgi:hypothetical protein
MFVVVMVLVHLVAGSPPSMQEYPMADLATCMEQARGKLVEAAALMDSGSRDTFAAGCVLKPGGKA